MSKLPSAQLADQRWQKPFPLIWVKLENDALGTVPCNKPVQSFLAWL